MFSRRTVLLLPSVLLFTACSASVKTEEKTIEHPYKLPPTLDPAPIAHVQGVGAYVGQADGVLYFLSGVGDSLVGVSDGAVVWQTATIAGFKKAGVVRASNRPWMVVHEGEKLKAYDLLSSGVDQAPLREAPAGEGVSISLFGAVHRVEGRWEKWSPANGTKAVINLPDGQGEVLAAVSTGYVYRKEGKVGVVSSAGKWEGEGEYLDSRSGVMAFAKKDGVVVFFDTVSGKIVGEGERSDGGGDGLFLVASTTENAYAFLKTLVLLQSDGRAVVREYKSEVVGVMDEVAYLKDGTGIDIPTQTLLWGESDSPQHIINNQALYLNNNELHIFKKK